MIGLPPWRVEFDEYGGYDCMSSAYTVKDASGHTLFVVDTANYGDAAPDENKTAQTVAEMAVQAVNILSTRT